MPEFLRSILISRFIFKLKCLHECHGKALHTFTVNIALTCHCHILFSFLFLSFPLAYPMISCSHRFIIYLRYLAVLVMFCSHHFNSDFSSLAEVLIFIVLWYKLDVTNCRASTTHKPICHFNCFISPFKGLLILFSYKLCLLFLYLIAYFYWNFICIILASFPLQLLPLKEDERFVFWFLCTIGLNNTAQVTEYALSVPFANLVWWFYQAAVLIWLQKSSWTNRKYA